MSETEDDDGGIDKEALREELREKYGEDDSEREATQRMSDLLLKGATMTNSHCNTCGDPLFRQNGTTFCPTCHGGPEGVDASAAVANPDEEEADRPTGNGRSVPNGAAAQPPSDQSQSGDADATPSPQADTQPGEPDESPAAGSETHAFDPATSPTNPDGRPAPEPADRQPPRSRDPGRHASSETPDRSTPPASGDVDGAADSLQAALERFAREAATTDDPRYARDCLEAAHEAADALAALRR